MAPSLTTKVRGGLCDALEVEFAKERFPGVRPFALRDLPMHDFPVPIGPHAKRAQDHPLLLALDGATTALGIVAVLARGIGDLDPHTIDQENRWRALKGLHLEHRQLLSHTRHNAVTGRKREHLAQGQRQRFLQVPQTVPQTIAHHLVVQQRPPAALIAHDALPGQRPVTPAQFGHVQVSNGTVLREQCPLIAATAGRLWWAPPGHMFIAIHPR